MRIIVLFLFLSLALRAQKEPQPEGKLPGVILIDLAYAFQLPEGNLKQDFSHHFNLGARLGYLLPNNWLFSINGETFFSDKVKTDVLAPLRIENGQLIDINGDMAYTQLGQRGFAVTAHVGRLFSLTKKPRRHSLEVRIGGGYLQHWFRIRLLGSPEDLPQLFGPYKKGYDRLTSGFAMHQYIGYRFMGRRKFFNAFIGLDFTQGFTQNRRFWNFDTRVAPNQPRLDLLLGLRAGFTVPFYIYSTQTRSDEIDFY